MAELEAGGAQEEKALLSMWMTAAGGSPPPEGKKKSRKIGREQISFVSLSWMEYFGFTFLLMLCKVSSAGSQGFGYSSFPTEKLCFFRTTFLLKQKGYCPGKDFDFMLLKWGNFFLQQLPSGFHSTFAPATSLGVLGTVPGVGSLQGAAPLVPHISLAVSGKQENLGITLGLHIHPVPGAQIGCQGLTVHPVG